MIELIDFGKDYGDFTAVERLNLKIDAGEMFGFIGPNGAGKSTSIRFLATLLRASRGEGIVNGYRVTQEPMKVRQSVGYMPDNFGVYDGMRVWEFLDFFAVAYRIGRSQRKTVINDVLELLDLAHKRDDYVNGLSRGMKQRLCLAKTLVHDPPVLILDEPASGLDPRARLEMKALLKELRRMGKTILISSHILHELGQLCTRIGIIEAGQMVEQGSLEEIYSKLRLMRVVHIRAKDPKPDLIHRIKELDGVFGVEEQIDRWALSLRESETAIEELHDQLVALGARISMYQPEAMDMETAFMKLTEGKTA